MLLLLLMMLQPLNVQPACLGVTECNCERASDGSGQIINCRNGDLTAVPTFDLTGSQTQYVELTLAGNRIGSIPGRAFSGLEFRRLDLSDNPLIHLDSSAFDGVEQGLSELRLTLSSDAEFPTAAISQLTRLRILRVAGFTGRQLPVGALSTLTQLEELALTSGSLAALNVADLNSQRGSLQTLVLHENQLSAVPTEALCAATMLTTVDLSHNQISSLKANVFSGCVNLNAVDLSNNGLGTGRLDAAAFNGVNSRLQTLKVMSCQLADGDMEALRQLHAVSNLILSYNSIANLPSNIFTRMRSLRQLRLDNNRLQTISRSTFSGVSSSLELLDLGHNPLSSVPQDVFSNLNYLHELRLDGVTTIQLGENSFSRRAVLRTLSVQGSGVGDRLWSIISNTERLNSLYASDCAISLIPDFAFRRNAALQTIDLSSNSISSLTQRSMYGLAGSLAVINFNDNSITTIHQCTFYSFSDSFDYFNLGLRANPLRCDCDIHWLYELLHATDPVRVGGLPWSCDDGRRFADLSDADFVSCPVQQPNCSVIAPPPDVEDGNSTDTGKIPLVLQAYNMSDTECLLEWSIEDDTAGITGFTVTSEVVHGSKPAASVSLPATARRYRLSDLRASTEYTVCITMMVSGPTTSGTYVCTSVWTNAAPDQPQHDEYGRLLTIILASIFAGTILIAVVAIAIVLLCRYCTGQQGKTAASSTSDFAVPRSTSTRPQVGFDSKRFTKERGGGAVNKPRTTVSTVGANEQAQTAFTAEERATILAMLDGTRVSTDHALNSRRATPRAYTNVGYEPGSLEFNADLNAQGHVYDTIPGEQFDNLPLDSPV